MVNDDQEIFISDNRAHCVKVFSYEGQFLRQIGGEGLTNYPIGKLGRTLSLSRRPKLRAHARSSLLQAFA